MEGRKVRKVHKVGAVHYAVWLAPILWVLFGVSLLILKYAPEGNKLLYITLVVSPGLIFLFILFWALDLSRPRVWHPWRPRPSLGVAGLVFLYVLFVLLYTPAYMASIRLGDQIVTDDNECITDYGRLTYFGLVTASTLGYGDIVPGIESGRTQLLVSVQVVEFWMFFAIAFATVARWIS